METHRLECRDISLIRTRSDGTEREVLKSVSALFKAGSTSLISGENGSGKSTLIHILAGILRPSSGEVLADGQPVSRWSSFHRDQWRRQVSLIFQHAHLLPELTSLENIMLPLVPQSSSLRAVRDQARRMLKQTGISSLEDKKAGLLSGGERQRLAVARGLAVNPAYLLMDEPTAHQDNRGVEIVLRCIKQLTAANCVTVIVSHDERLKDSSIFSEKYLLTQGILGKQ